MSRLMSVTLTEDAVVARRKTVTRRTGWRFLKPGDRLTLCRKVMGRRDGEPLVRLAEVEVVDVRREPLWDITDDDIAREGVDPNAAWFDEYDPETLAPTPGAWVRWFCEEMHVRPDDEVTRIEWRYLDLTLGACARCGAARTSTTTRDAEGLRAVLVCSLDASHGPDRLATTERSS